MGFENWDEFIRSFTNDEFIIKSKQFREIICGKIGMTRKTASMYRQYLLNVHETINLTFDDIECSISDEIVYKWSNDKVSKINEIQEILDKKYPKLFKVECYVIRSILGRKHFVKEILQIKFLNVLIEILYVN